MLIRTRSHLEVYALEHTDNDLHSYQPFFQNWSTLFHSQEEIDKLYKQEDESTWARAYRAEADGRRKYP